MSFIAFLEQNGSESVKLFFNKRFLKEMISRKNKLTTRSQFQSIVRKSTRFIGKYIIIDARINQVVNTRLGITVVRRYGKAHDRNRIRRQIREAFRLSHVHLCEGMDINIRPRPFAHFAKTQNIIDDLIQLIGSEKEKDDSTQRSPIIESRAAKSC